MEKTYDLTLIQRVQAYMEQNSISQNQLAGKVNISSAALSSYLNQKYKGSVEAVERQLREFFKITEEAAAVAERTGDLLVREEYIPTSISEDVYQSIRFAQLEHCMVVLHGDAGVGKSKGAQKFLRDHAASAVGVSITPSTGNLTGAIKLLARAVRVPECRNKMDQVVALRQRLDGTNMVIVIDEAQHLKYAALEEIRALTDDNPMTGEHGVGVVLIGNSEVYTQAQEVMLTAVTPSAPTVMAASEFLTGCGYDPTGVAATDEILDEVLAIVNAGVTRSLDGGKVRVIVKEKPASDIVVNWIIRTEVE